MLLLLLLVVKRCSEIPLEIDNEELSTLIGKVGQEEVEDNDAEFPALRSTQVGAVEEKREFVVPVPDVPEEEEEEDTVEDVEGR